MVRFFAIILQVGGVALYGYTLYLAYTLSGIGAVIMSAMFPGISNLYWIYDRWSVTGELLNFYTNLNLLWIAVYIIGIVGFGMSAKLSEKEVS